MKINRKGQATVELAIALGLIVIQLGRRRDCRIERDARQKQRVFVPLVDRGNHGGIARPHRNGPSGAGGDGCQRGAPGAAADEGEPVHAAPADAISAETAASSGHRGRTGASSPSVRPRRSLSSPAQAIIAPLSVQSAGGGGTKSRSEWAASSFSRRRSIAFAAPPPAATSVFPSG